MEPTKLTAVQIDKLYKFTRAHYVEHYDLQTELVDHLANGIEQQWYKSPNKSFLEALNEEYKKFGVFGFHDVIKDKRNAMTKKYYKLFWRFFKGWFRLPKLLVTFSIIGLVYFLLRMANHLSYKPTIVLSILVFAMVVLLVYFFWSRKNRELKAVKNGKKFMLAEMIYNFGEGVLLIQLPLQVGIALNTSKDWIFFTLTFDIVFSIFTVLMTLGLYIALQVLPSKAESLLQETYPEYNFA